MPVKEEKKDELLEQIIKETEDAILDSIPIKEKSNIPWIRKPFQPSLRWMTFGGTSLVMHTKDFSSSVFPMKLYSASRFTSE